MDLDPRIAPLFNVQRLEWEAPSPDNFDALILTSVNAMRHGGANLSFYLHLPCFAVGETTAEAAREAGFAKVRAGPGDLAALLDEIVSSLSDGERIRLLHLCGREHIAAERAGLLITRIPVYAAESVHELPGAAAEAIREGALVLLHSPRAAAQFAKLVDEQSIPRDTIRIAAISAAAAEAAGEGWALKAVADAPRDETLLALAARLLGAKD